MQKQVSPDQLLADFLDRAIGHLPLSILVTVFDPDNPRTVYANKAFTALTGYTQHEIHGKNPKLLQGPRTDRKVLDHLNECLLTSQIFVGQTFNYRKDGSEFLMQWTIFEISFLDRQYYIAIQRDASNHEDLHQKQKRLISLVADFHDASCELLSLVAGIAVAIHQGAASASAPQLAAELTALTKLLRSLQDLQYRSIESILQQ